MAVRMRFLFNRHLPSLQKWEKGEVRRRNRYVIRRECLRSASPMRGLRKAAIPSVSLFNVAGSYGGKYCFRGFCRKCNLFTESQSILDIALRIGESQQGKVDMGLGHV